MSTRIRLEPLDKPLLMLMAVRQQQALGVVIATYGSGAKRARLLSCWVRPDVRNQGIGTALLQRMQHLLKHEGCTHVEVHYRSNWNGTPAFEQILQRLQWSPPTCKHVLCVHDDMPRLLQAPWLQRAKVPDGITLFPWTDLSAAEAEDIRRTQVRDAWFDAALNPFQLAHILEPTTSFGLRQEGRVVGWVVRHKVKPDTLQCTALVAHTGAPFGCGLALLRHTIATQVGLGIPKSSYMIDGTNHKMIAFMRRRLAPYGMTEAQNRVAEKRLTATNDLPA